MCGYSYCGTMFSDKIKTKKEKNMANIIPQSEKLAEIIIEVLLDPDTIGTYVYQGDIFNKCQMLDEWVRNLKLTGLVANGYTVNQQEWDRLACEYLKD